MTVRPELRPARRWHSGPLPRVFLRTLGCHRRTHSPVFRVRFAATSSRDSPALRRLVRPRPPRRSRINRPAKALRAGPVFLVLTHDRPDPARSSRVHRVRRRDGSPECRAPLLRFSSPSAFAGHARVLMCPEAPSSLGRSRFDLCVLPARASSRTCRLDLALAGFRFWRTRRDEARVAGVPARALEPNPSLTLLPVPARRFDALPDILRDMATARRPVARSRRTSSTVRAGVTGETGRLVDRQPFEPA